LNHETHERDERRERLSCVSCPFAPFVFQTAHDEQHRIVVYLDDLQAQVDEFTALQDATQAELDALLPSVLDKAFKGEL
jgi:type I restriction enzyme S subunit